MLGKMVYTCMYVKRSGETGEKTFCAGLHRFWDISVLLPRKLERTIITRAQNVKWTDKSLNVR